MHAQVVTSPVALFISARKIRWHDGGVIPWIRLIDIAPANNFVMDRTVHHALLPSSSGHQ
jgi:hypothetical protein